MLVNLVIHAVYHADTKAFPVRNAAAVGLMPRNLVMHTCKPYSYTINNIMGYNTKSVLKQLAIR